MHYIYLTENLINGKKYIGQRKVPKKGIDLDSYLGSGTKLLYAIKKYGRNNFKKHILYVCINYEQSDFLETLEIEKRNAVNSDEYYNIQDGGMIDRSNNYSKIVSKSMSDFYANDDNYTSSILKINRRRYEKGLTLIKITTLAEKDLNKLRCELIKKNDKRNRIERNEVLKLIQKSYNKTSPEERSLRSSNAAKKLWGNKELKDKLVTKLTIKNRQRALNNEIFTDDVRKSLSMRKLEATNNYFGIYLLNSGLPNLKLLYKRISKINTNTYKDNNNALKQLKSILNDVYSEYGVSLNEDVALYHINKHREENCK